MLWLTPTCSILSHAVEVSHTGHTALGLFVCLPDSSSPRSPGAGSLGNSLERNVFTPSALSHINRVGNYGAGSSSLCFHALSRASRFLLRLETHSQTSGCCSWPHIKNQPGRL